MKLLISACLLGVCCRYDQSQAVDDIVCLLAKKHELVPVCPEQLGGLATPREPAEILNNRVITKSKTDVTAQFERGAAETLKIAKALGCTAAVLKQRSPSCGCGEIYDGSFSGSKIVGNGITARLLIQNGVCVVSEDAANMFL